MTMITCDLCHIKFDPDKDEIEKIGDLFWCYQCDATKVERENINEHDLCFNELL